MSLLAVLSKALCCWHAFKVWSTSPFHLKSLDNKSPNLDSFFTESESLRSGTPVKSDISGGGSVSGYGTGADSTGSDKTPPYLPKSKVICNPMDHLHQHQVTYAQLALPPPSAQNHQQHHLHHPRYTVNDRVIYSQIDLSRKSSDNRSRMAVNPDDPSSWAPLLGSRNGPESSL